MELFQNIRLRIGMAVLRKRVTRSNRRMVYKNFREVKTIGIVWNASRDEEFQSLARFHQKMQERNIDLKVIGYFHGKHLPDKYTAIRYLMCFKNSETNLFYRPDSPEVISFIKTKFDILIDLNFEKLFTLTYISRLSEAYFKVGLFDTDEDNSPFDLMMEIKKPVNTEDFLDKVIQYLQMIIT